MTRRAFRVVVTPTDSGELGSVLDVVVEVTASYVADGPGEHDAEEVEVPLQNQVRAALEQARPSIS